MRDRTNGGSSFYVICTLVILLGITVAVLKWRSGPREAQWQAFTAGTSATRQPLPLPTVYRPP